MPTIDEKIAAAHAHHSRALSALGDARDRRKAADGGRREAIAARSQGRVEVADAIDRLADALDAEAEHIARPFLLTD